MLPETSTLVGTYKHRETLIHVERAHMLATYKHSDRQLEKTWGSGERRRCVCFKGLPTPGEMNTELGRPKHFPRSRQTFFLRKRQTLFTVNLTFLLSSQHLCHSVGVTAFTGQLSWFGRRLTACLTLKLWPLVTSELSGASNWPRESWWGRET